MILLPRIGPSNADRRKIEVAVHDPHEVSERFDPEFLLMFQCGRCEKVSYAPRKLIREAMMEHTMEDCPCGPPTTSEPIAIRIFYPKQ